MSNFFWVVLGALLMSTIDYLMFYFGLNTENQKWNWFEKRTKFQKISILSGVFLVMFVLNIVS
ncbi:MULTISPECIES: hypothetical protein [Bacillaceae]|uniref:hypothetical protein n=1 Tax=Bacillaceae TaxID=186817 RepID=UPI000BED43FA|nr:MULTISPECIES: hypothetical protein [unclassified Bacillus (in: firmicutes)]PEC47629.1 hypothetical protein CON00_19590 [Bacillus sp. AFS096315]PFM83118.1 hypothetical protein COJ46_04830 [Bacillus sp. AFS077874]